ncbi:uncharacterized protein LOC132850168 [Tachysurus vachellii]|uniref:uncharacterized protein LOC132850168 n=1 Tax=Tachysurus vachellii TaxID=175792 RepID=UPI00296B291E|nr:uncharacterized protein LOC132850168 [Tachysurus vachellii]
MAKIEICLVLFFLLGLCADCEFVATGTNCTLKSAITGPIELGDWRYNGNLVVEWDIKTGFLEWYRFQDRAKLNLANGDLSVVLKKEDSGVFKAQFQVNRVLQYFERTIKVIDPVTKPKVTCEENDQGIKLICSLVPPVEAEFKWTGPNGFSDVGNSTQIDRNQNDDSVYYCSVKNEVSEESAELNPKDCFGKGPNEINIGAVVGGIIATLGFIGLVVTSVFIHKKKGYSGGARGKESTPTGGKQPQSNTNSPDDGVNVPLSQDAPNQIV